MSWKLEWAGEKGGPILYSVHRCEILIIVGARSCVFVSTLHDKYTIIYTYSPSCLDEKIENTLLTLVALMAQISFKNLVVAIATLEKIQVHICFREI